jgi:hypothetical protein
LRGQPESASVYGSKPVMLRYQDTGTVVLYKDGDLTFTLNILHKLTDRVDIMYEAAAVLNTINKNLQNFDQATQEARLLVSRRRMMMLRTS